MRFLLETFRLQAECGANILATSRIDEEIVKIFTDAICLKIRARDDDVKVYLDERMRLQQSDILDDATRNAIQKNVVEATDGM